MAEAVGDRRLRHLGAKEHIRWRWVSLAGMGSSIRRQRHQWNQKAVVVLAVLDVKGHDHDDVLLLIHTKRYES